MVRELRDPGTIGSLELELGRLKEAYDRMPGVHIALHHALPFEPSEALRDVIVAVTREALTNAVKHGQAQHIEVRVAAEQGALRLDMEDDGVGLRGDPASAAPSTKPTGFGVLGMRERVESVGGQLALAARSGTGRQGTSKRPGARVTARFPLEASA